MLKDQHRVRIGERRHKHVACILEDRRRQNTKPRDVCVPSFETVRVLCSNPPPTPGRHSDHQWHRELATRHVWDRGGIVDDLIEREQAEIDRHDLDDRPHAGECRADTGADKSALRKRRIAYPLLAEFVEQSLSHGVATAVSADILAHDEGAGISNQRVPNRLPTGLAIGHAAVGWRRGGAHLGTRSMVTKRSKSPIGSRVAASAKATAAAISASTSLSMRLTSSAW